MPANLKNQKRDYLLTLHIRIEGMAQKSWFEKFHNGQYPRIETCNKPFSGIPAGEKFLISSPAEIDAYIRGIEPGKFVTLNTMRRDLAQVHQVEYTCPLTTGIFTRIVAELAFEQYQKGTPLEGVTPFWRVVDANVAFASKLACGPLFLKKQRQAERIEASVKTASKTKG